ncbi:hypothetical protein GCM10011585_29200 [Edaphobacter dinghuensis]|uniref:Uncharacterized protein n=1 Tax=Edaphobacter dinghuensis TaxID=1560005 RepID=A0A917HMZ7_9BACT|nr:hypothetical protein GCM10011585_29200 [Edaphobacter dinghuensis]
METMWLAVFEIEQSVVCAKPNTATIVFENTANKINGEAITSGITNELPVPVSHKSTSTRTYPKISIPSGHKARDAFYFERRIYCWAKDGKTLAVKSNETAGCT